MLPDNLKLVIEEARTGLLGSPNCRLTFSYRRRIWEAMGSFNAAPDSAIANVGKIRRARLAANCVAKSLDRWEHVFPSDRTPHIALKIINYILSSNQQPESLRCIIDDLRMHIDGLATSFNNAAIYTGFAAVAAFSVLIDDERNDISQEGLIEYDPFDPFDWDTAYCSAEAFAHDSPGAENSSLSLMREFWEWYLDEAVVEAYLFAKDGP